MLPSGFQNTYINLLGVKTVPPRSYRQTSFMRGYPVYYRMANIPVFHLPEPE